MAKRLLDRQAKLIEYLTSGAAIFGRKGAAPLDRTLRGIDRGLLQLEAHFSHEKRMEKIVAVFPRTFKILGDNRAEIIRDFAAACPPVDLSRLVNARQFFDFLCARWKSKPPRPRYLRDVAACELARARVRVDVSEDGSEAKEDRKDPCPGSIRRGAGVVLLRCAYDVRSIFEDDLREAIPTKRNTTLAIAMPPGTTDPRVSEVLPVVFDLLSVLDDWGDPVALGLTPDLDDLIHELVEHGLLEVRG